MEQQGMETRNMEQQSMRQDIEQQDIRQQDAEQQDTQQQDAEQRNMQQERKMNVLVLGATGAGKSTLIRSISETRLVVGSDRSAVRKIDIYESDTWPLRFIDTRGFENGRARQKRKAKKQISAFSKEQLRKSGKAAEHAGVDVVWFCLEGTSRKDYEKNVKLMAKEIRRWRDVPVFVVITKSYFPQDIEENRKAVIQALAKVKRINLQQILPVVAKEAFLDEMIKVPPLGIAELCEATLECADTAKQISADNRRRMGLEQKKFTANTVVGTAAAAAAAIGAVPFSFADSAILVPLETMLTRSILKIYRVQFSGELVSAIVGSAAITNVAKAVLTPLKALPIAGSVINGVVAGTIVLALGEAEIAVGEAIYTGKLDPSRMDDIIRTIEEKTANSPVIGNVVKYLQENAPSLVGKNSKEIFAILQRLLRKKLLK